MKTLLLLLLLLLTVSACVSIHVVGQTGQNVTLTCKYDVKYHGVLLFCWGRGQLPSRGCSNQLIYADGYKVVSKASRRYQILGRLDQGDISLTILNITEDDAGRYGCRVQVFGWFNDDKHHFDLIVEAPEMTSSPTSETPTETTAANQTAGHMTSSENLLTSRQSFLPEDATEDGGMATVVLVLVLFVLVVLVTAGGLFLLLRRWRQLKQSQQIWFRSSSSTQQLQRGGSAVENIYQIDDGGDVDVYERCP